MSSILESHEPDLNVSKFPSFEYSMNEVRRAGGVIAGPLDATDPNIKDCVEAFRIANNWRDAHAYPMRSVRYQLIAYLRTLNVSGITAARLKRMQAIRRKLRRISLNLNQLQDLAGCRAILPTVRDVDLVAAVLKDRSRHILRRSDNYIESPKEKDGYRSHHLIFEYQGNGEAAVYDGRRIEIQIRTRLQHSWATAVEAVGLFRGEDLKGSKGSDQWLRLFKLMSAEFAVVESCPEPIGVPRHHERIAEIKALNSILMAESTLDNLTNAVKWTELSVSLNDKPSYYLIKYDNATNQVEVEAYFNPLVAVKSYDQAEHKDNESGENSTNVVLVEAGKVDQLKEAYPNYFGDVQLFRQNLKRLCSGKPIKDFELAPQERVFQPRPEQPDFSWMKRRGRWSD